MFLIKRMISSFITCTPLNVRYHNLKRILAVIFVHLIVSKPFRLDLYKGMKDYTLLIGLALARARTDSGLSRPKLGKLFGKGADTIQRWESDARRISVADTLECFAAMHKDVFEYYYKVVNPDTDSDIYLKNLIQHRLDNNGKESLIHILERENANELIEACDKLIERSSTHENN